MSYENMPRLQTERFERQIPTFIANDNIKTVNERIVVPVLSTTKVIYKYLIVMYLYSYIFFSYLKLLKIFECTTVAYL